MAAYQWVDLMKYDSQKEAFIHLVRCILDKDGIRFKGNESLISSLKDGVELSGHRKIHPHDKRRFLDVLANTFTSPYLLSSAVLEGPTLAPFAPPQKRHI